MEFIKKYIKNHPFNSGIFTFLLLLIILTFISESFSTVDQFYEKNTEIFLLIWLIILGILTSYAAKLRGRSMLWGILFGIGLIIITILPIKNRIKN